jgi:hypothetical protein
VRFEPDSATDAPPADVPAADAPPSDAPPNDEPVAAGGPIAAALEASLAEEESAVEPTPPSVPPTLRVVDVTDLDWPGIRDRVRAAVTRAHLRDVVERMETLLDRDGGPRLLFDDDRTDANDRAIRVSQLEADVALWIVGDIHGDLLALEAALELVQTAAMPNEPAPRLVFLGDFFDDGGHGLEVLLRVFEVILDAPHNVCIIAGNHDAALDYTGAGFTSTVTPSDFSEFLNANLAHEWITRAGKLAVRLFSAAPRALFLPDGLLVTHGGFPLVDLHAGLRESGDWNDPRCLDDFTWTRAHPRARKKMPNRTTRGSQFGYEDFAAFCDLSAELGRPVTHMVRGHDHVEERYEIYPAYAAHPVVTTVALSRRLAREAFGPYERAPTVARWVEGALPQVHRLCIPAAVVRDVYPGDDAGAAERHTTDAPVREST